MRYTVTLISGLPRAAIEARLASLFAAGPFGGWDLVHLGGGAWSFTFQPLRPGLAIGFAKIAEMLVLIAREFDVESVERSAVGALAAAS